MTNPQTNLPGTYNGFFAYTPAMRSDYELSVLNKLDQIIQLLSSGAAVTSSSSSSGNTTSSNTPNVFSNSLFEPNVFSPNVF